MANLIECKECGREISKKASTCPGCGFDFKGERETNDQVIGCLVIIAVLIGSWFWITSGDPAPRTPPTPWDQVDEWSMASVQAERHVRQRLASPGSAKFQGVMQGLRAGISRDGQVYTVISYVDSQNQYGALLRTNFKVVVEQVRKDEWVLRELEFLD